MFPTEEQNDADTSRVNQLLANSNIAEGLDQDLLDKIGKDSVDEYAED